MSDMQLNLIVNPTINNSALVSQAAAAGKASANAFQTAFSKSQPLGRITGSVSEFEKSMEAANARVLAFGASAGSIYVIKSAFDKLISSTIFVEKSLTDVNVVLGLGTTALKTFSNEMFKAASQTGQTFETASKVALEFARHGVTAAETAKRMTSAMQLMRISGLSAQEAVNSITAAINAFNKEGLTSESIVNRLTAVDTKFAVSAQDLSKAIERVGATAQDAGVQFNELLGLVTAAQTITARGGAVIGNAFKSIFTRLARPEVLNDLESVGVATKNASGSILPMVTILKNLASEYNHLSYSQKSFISEAVGGVYQVNILKASLTDLGSGFSVFDKATITAATSAGLIEKRMSALNDTISSKLNASTNELTKLFSSLGQTAFGGSSKSGIDTFTKQIGFIGKSLEDIDVDDNVGVKIGKTFATGIAKGLGDIISGPGVQIAAVLLTKVFANIGKFAIESGREFMGANDALRKQEAILGSVQNFLKNNEQIVNAIKNGQLSVNQVHGLFLNQLKQEATLRSAANQISTSVATQAAPYINAVKTTGKGFAAGHIPAFAARQEEANARALGASVNVKAIIGPGKINGRPYIANNEERIFKGVGSDGSDMVLPTYRSAGYIPNFAIKGLEGINISVLAGRVFEALVKGNKFLDLSERSTDADIVNKNGSKFEIKLSTMGALKDSNFGPGKSKGTNLIVPKDANKDLDEQLIRLKKAKITKSEIYTRGDAFGIARKILARELKNPNTDRTHIPLFAAEDFHFDKSFEEGGITRLTGIYGKDMVGDLEYSGRGTKEIEAFNINKKYRGFGIAQHFYGQMNKEIGKGKIKGTLLPNYDKNEDVYFPQLSRANEAKSSSIIHYDPMENPLGTTVKKFKQLIQKNKSNKKFWEENSFDLHTSHAAGHIPNFALAGLEVLHPENKKLAGKIIRGNQKERGEAATKFEDNTAIYLRQALEKYEGTKVLSSIFTRSLSGKGTGMSGGKSFAGYDIITKLITENPELAKKLGIDIGSVSTIATSVKGGEGLSLKPGELQGQMSVGNALLEKLGFTGPIAQVLAVRAGNLPGFIDKEQRLAGGHVPNFSYELFRGVGGGRIQKRRSELAEQAQKLSQEELQSIIFEKHLMGSRGSDHKRRTFFNDTGKHHLSINNLKDYLSMHQRHGGASGFLSTSSEESVAKKFAEEHGGAKGVMGTINVPKKRILDKRNLEKLIKRFGSEKVSKVILNSTSEANAAKGRKNKFLGFDVNTFSYSEEFSEEEEVALMAGGHIPNFAELYRGIGGGRIRRKEAELKTKLNQEDAQSIIFQKKPMSLGVEQQKKRAFFNDAGRHSISLGELKKYFKMHQRGDEGSGLLSTSLHEKVAAEFAENNQSIGTQSVIGKLIMPQSRIITEAKLEKLAERFGLEKTSKVLLNSSSEANAAKGRKNKFVGFDVNSFTNIHPENPKKFWSEQEVALMAGGHIPNFAHYFYDSDLLAGTDKATIREAILANNTKKNLIHGPSGSGKTHHASTSGLLPILGMGDIDKASEITLLSGSGKLSPMFLAQIEAVNRTGGSKKYLNVSDDQIKAQRQSRLTNKYAHDTRSEAQLGYTAKAPLNDPAFIAQLHELGFQNAFAAGSMPFGSFTSLSKSGLRGIMRDPSVLKQYIDKDGTLRIPSTMSKDAVNLLGSLDKKDRINILKSLGVKRIVGSTDPDVHASIGSHPTGYGTSFFGPSAGGHYDRSFANGHIPNFSALNKAVNREMSAGYSSSQIIIGSDPSLISGFNPDGLGVANKTEGSLSNGIALARAAGIDPKTKGMSAGHIPNFDLTESLLLGGLQGGMGDKLSEKLRRFADGFDRTIESTHKINSAYSSLTTKLRAGEKVEFGGQSYEQKDLKDFIRDFKAANSSLGNKAERAKQEEQYVRYNEQLLKRQEQTRSVGFGMMTGGPMAAQIASTAATNMGFADAGKAIETFSSGITQAGQFLYTFPGKVGKTLAAFELVSSGAKSMVSFLSEVASRQKIYDIASTNFEKLNGSLNSILQSYDTLDSLYKNGTATTEQFMQVTKILNKNLIDLSLLTGGKGLVSEMTSAGTLEQRQVIAAKAQSAAEENKNQAGAIATISQLQDKEGVSGMFKSFLGHMGVGQGLFSSVTTTGQRESLETAKGLAGSMMSSLMTPDKIKEMEGRSAGISQRFRQSVLTEDDVKIMKELAVSAGTAGEAIRNGFDPASFNYVLEQFKNSLLEFQIPPSVKDIPQYLKGLEELRAAQRKELIARLAYNSELDSMLRKGIALSSLHLQEALSKEKTRFSRREYEGKGQEIGLSLESLYTTPSEMFKKRGELERTGAGGIEEKRQSNITENKIKMVEEGTRIAQSLLGPLKDTLANKKIGEETSPTQISPVKQGQINAISQRMDYFAKTPKGIEEFNKLIQEAPNGQQFAEKYLGPEGENLKKTDETTYGQLVEKLSKAYEEGSGNLQQILQQTQNINNDALNKMVESLQRQEAAIKEANFKDLATKLGGMSALLSGSKGTMEERRKITRAEMMERSKDPIRRGAGAAAMLKEIPDEMRDYSGGFTGRLFEEAVQGREEQIRRTTKGRKLGGFYNSEKTREAAVAAVTKDLPGINIPEQYKKYLPTLTTQTPPADEGKERDAVLKKLIEGHIDLKPINDDLKSAGEAIKRFATMIEDIGTKLDEKTAQHTETEKGVVAAQKNVDAITGNTPGKPQGDTKPPTGAGAAIGSNIASGLAMGAAMAASWAAMQKVGPFIMKNIPRLFRRRLPFAEGYIPDQFSGHKDQFSSEEAKARSLGAINPKAHFGKGTIKGERFLMNSEEMEIPNFAGGADSAVIPKYAGGNPFDMLGGHKFDWKNFLKVPGSIEEEKFLKQLFISSIKNFKPKDILKKLLTRKNLWKGSKAMGTLIAVDFAEEKLEEKFPILKNDDTATGALYNIIGKAGIEGAIISRSLPGATFDMGARLLGRVATKGYKAVEANIKSKTDEIAGSGAEGLNRLRQKKPIFKPGEEPNTDTLKMIHSFQTNQKLNKAQKELDKVKQEIAIQDQAFQAARALRLKKQQERDEKFSKQKAEVDELINRGDEGTDFGGKYNFKPQMGNKDFEEFLKNPGKPEEDIKRKEDETKLQGYKNNRETANEEIKRLLKLYKNKKISKKEYEDGLENARVPYTQEEYNLEQKLNPPAAELSYGEKMRRDNSFYAKQDADSQAARAAKLLKEHPESAQYQPDIWVKYQSPEAIEEGKREAELAKERDKNISLKKVEEYSKLSPAEQRMMPNPEDLHIGPRGRPGASLSDYENAPNVIYNPPVVPEAKDAVSAGGFGTSKEELKRAKEFIKNRSSQNPPMYAEGFIPESYDPDPKDPQDIKNFADDPMKYVQERALRNKEREAQFKNRSKRQELARINDSEAHSYSTMKDLQKNYKYSRQLDRLYYNFKYVRSEKNRKAHPNLTDEQIQASYDKWKKVVEGRFPGASYITTEQYESDLGKTRIPFSTTKKQYDLNKELNSPTVTPPLSYGEKMRRDNDFYSKQDADSQAARAAKLLKEHPESAQYQPDKWVKYQSPENKRTAELNREIDKNVSLKKTKLYPQLSPFEQGMMPNADDLQIGPRGRPGASLSDYENAPNVIYNRPIVPENLPAGPLGTSKNDLIEAQKIISIDNKKNNRSIMSQAEIDKMLGGNYSGPARLGPPSQKYIPGDFQKQYDIDPGFSPYPRDTRNIDPGFSPYPRDTRNIDPGFSPYPRDTRNIDPGFSFYPRDTRNIDPGFSPYPRDTRNIDPGFSPYPRDTRNIDPGFSKGLYHGGIVPGYASGHDSVPTMLSPGEMVIPKYAAGNMENILSSLSALVQKGGEKAASQAAAAPASQTSPQSTAKTGGDAEAFARLSKSIDALQKAVDSLKSLKVQDGNLAISINAQSLTQLVNEKIQVAMAGKVSPPKVNSPKGATA
jgi:TP901 family phage tail tape measure protein